MTITGKASQTLTPMELEIMQVLWKQGACTVADVQRKLRGDPAYTTVQTMLNVLLRKKKVKRMENTWAFRYRAVVSRERAAGSALSDLVKRMFGGSSEALLMAMVETRQISQEDLARIAKKLAALQAKGKDPGELRAPGAPAFLPDAKEPGAAEGATFKEKQ